MSDDISEHDILPRLRTDLHMTALEMEGRRVVVVQDPLGLAPGDQAFSLDLLRLWAGLPEGATLGVFRDLVGRHAGGASVPLEEIRQVVDLLDSSHLLDSESHALARQAVVDEYMALEARPPAMAGTAYPADPVELAAWLDAVLDGAPPEQGATKDAPEHDVDKPVVGLIAPHIDPQVGAGCYKAAYAGLRGAAIQRVVVLGVGHSPMDGLFCFSSKAMDTPLGRVPVDAEAVARLARAAAAAAVPAEVGDLPHRAEHSVEFQALFLQRVLAPGWSVVPVLCGSALSLPAYSRSAFRQGAGAFCAALADMLAEPGTLCVAGVDFCHIGPKFGHQAPAIEMEAEARAHETVLLERLAALDPEGFWAESARNEDGFNVCGFLAMATLLEALAGLRDAGTPLSCQVLDHSIWHEQPTQSAVGFAAAVFQG